MTDGWRNKWLPAPDIHYILDGKLAIPVPDLMQWALWFERADRRVGLDEIGPFRVSTIFLGLDHSFGRGPPLIFETMVFTDDAFVDTVRMFNARVDYLHVSREHLMRRYSSWVEAERGHKVACRWARAKAAQLDRLMATTTKAERC